MTFDPDDAAKPGAGVYGLPHTRDDASIILIPVPFDATTSYAAGAAAAPQAIRAASVQVDLYDHQFGAVYEAGVFMEEPDAAIAQDSRAARALAEPIIAKGGAEPGDEAAVAQVDAASLRMITATRARVAAALDDGKVPGLVGGDHSCALPAILACAHKHADQPVGVLQIDAHMDLRESYEGFRYSHASIMHNALAETPNLQRLVMIGIRDYAQRESRAAENSGGRVRPRFDLNWRTRMDRGDTFTKLCAEAIEALPQLVYISFDIDGLDPALCPHTGTPVPGGLTFTETCILLDTLRRSGKRVIGFDLCEVRPPPPDHNDSVNEWDANVGARILYKLCGVARATSA